MPQEQIQPIFLDFEFSGINNHYTNNHVITQMMLYAPITKESVLTKKAYESFRFSTGNAEISTGALIKLHTTNVYEKSFAKWYNDMNNDREKDNYYLFNKEIFELVLNQFKRKHNINIKNSKLVMFSPQKDIEYLAEQDIYLENYVLGVEDAKEQLQLYSRKMEYKMATECSSLECCYAYVLMDNLNRTTLDDEHFKLINLIKHGTRSEMAAIEDIYNYCQFEESMAKQEPNKLLQFYPFGKYAGMDLVKYVELNRRQADGYRFNNDDLLSDSLTAVIEEIDERIFNDENPY